MSLVQEKLHDLQYGDNLPLWLQFSVKMVQVEIFHLQRVHLSSSLIVVQSRKNHAQNSCGSLNLVIGRIAVSVKVVLVDQNYFPRIIGQP